MNFIETLKSVGGVKPRPCGISSQELTQAYAWRHPNGCPECHGTGSIIDLAPLLAKPKELEDCVRDLCFPYKEISMKGLCGVCCKDLNGGVGFCSLPCQGIWLNTHEVNGYAYGHRIEQGLGSYGYYLGKKPPEKACIRVPMFSKNEVNLHVIGPQRASNLVYEVARQLGGTAVVAEPDNIEDTRDGIGGVWNTIYYLSLPIPDSATVLFVTDKWDKTEMTQVVQTTITSNEKAKALDYLLCLIGPEKTEQELDCRFGTNGRMKVISLQQERT
jgi:hypothetical protein